MLLLAAACSSSPPANLRQQPICAAPAEVASCRRAPEQPRPEVVRRDLERQRLQLARLRRPREVGR